MKYKTPFGNPLNTWVGHALSRTSLMVPGTTIALAMSLMPTSNATADVIAGWDTFTDTGGKVYDATVLTAGITGQAVGTAPTGSGWANWGNAANSNGASNDGTWGTSSEAPTPSIDVSQANQAVGLLNATASGDMAFTVTNNSGAAYVLDGFHFDGGATRTAAAKQWSLSILAGGAITSVNNIQTGALPVNLSAPLGDFDIDLVGLADRTLEDGQSVTFSLAFTTGAGSGAGGNNAMIDNVAVTGVIDSPNKLKVITVPAGATAGVDFSVTVQAQDIGGGALSVAADTTITLNSSGLGTLSGNTATILAGQSSVTLNSVQYTKAEPITLTAIRTSGDLIGTGTPSTSFTVVAGAASQVAFSTQPSASSTTSSAFATQPVVQVQDAFGNLVSTGSDASVNVALTLTNGTGTLGGTTTLNALAGVADFTGAGLNIDAAGTDKVLTATATIAAGLVTADSSPAFAIDPPPLTWLGTPATYNWTTANEVNWSGGSGVYSDSAEVTFDETGSAASPINLDGTLFPDSVTVNSDTKNYTFSGGGISGSTGLTKSGASTLTVSTANYYTGMTTVNGGTLVNGSAFSFDRSGQLTVEGTGTFDLNGSVAAFTKINAGTITGTITNSGPLAYLTAAAQAATIINNLITGNVALDIANNHNSNSFLNLANVNTFTGGMTLLDGTGSRTRLRINAAITGTPFGTGPITLGLSNSAKAGILFDTVSNTLTNDVVFNTAQGTDVPGIRFDTTNNVLSGGITANFADATFAAGNINTGAVALTGKITGPYGLALTPSASASTSTMTLTLSNAAADNDYVGDTTLTNLGSSNYTLVLGTADQIPNGAGKGNVINNGTLNLNVFSETINGLSGSGIVEASDATLTVGDNDATSTFDGIMQGALSVTKIGAGTLTLNGANAYSGDTTVDGRVLAVNGTSLPDTTTLTINTGAVVEPTGTEVVAALDFGSGPVAEGTYGATNSGAINIDNIHFSGDAGVVSVVAVLSGYATWATANVNGQTPGEDFNLDGVDNGIAYFMDDTGSITLPGLVGGSITWSNGGNIPASAYGTEFVVQTSPDLSNWTPVGSGDLTTNTDSTLTYTLTPGLGKRFVRLVVTPK